MVISARRYTILNYPPGHLIRGIIIIKRFCVKDYRRTLYWNPNIMLDKDGKATITLYNNARTTQISVDAAGQAADGTLLWGVER